MRYLHKLAAVSSAALFIAGSAVAQNAGTVTNHAFAIGGGPGGQGYTSLLCASAQLAVGQAAADPICQTLTGDVTLSAAGVTTLATVNSNVGSFGSATQSAAVTVNAKGLITAASASTITPAIGSVTGLGTGCATFLATPSSANLRGCLTDEVGTGASYFIGGALGTPASATLTNATGLPPGGLTTQAAYTFLGNNTGSVASPTTVDIAALTTKASPGAADYVMLSDQAASGAWKKASVSSLATAGSVSSIAGNTGTFTLSTGITNVGNDIRLSVPVSVANGGTNYTGGAWTAWTPTITATGGAFTTVSATGSYLVIGKLVHFTVSITQTSVGTASGKITLPLPVGTAAHDFVAAVVEASVVGTGGFYAVTALGSSGTIGSYNNSATMIGNGFKLVVTGIYEQS